MSSATVGAYPERSDPKRSAIDELGARAAGVILRRTRGRLAEGHVVVARAGELGPELEGLDDAALRAMADDLRVALRRDGFGVELVARTFALVREVASRTLGQRHYDVQLLGGWVLLRGMLAEMETGEGKTLTATLPACAVALSGVPVHVISVNDYLVARDAEEMGPVYRFLGLSVGAIQQGMSPDERRAIYASDVTYVSNKEIAFDFLKDRITLGGVRSRAQLRLEKLSGASRSDRLLLRGLCFGIVDEADSVLVDEARTPLIISGQGEVDDTEEEVYEQALALAAALEPETDFRIDARERSVRISDEGREHLAELAEGLGGIWSGPERSGELVTRALTALHLFEKDKHYLLVDGEVQIIDEYTGRLMPDRAWERGLHQMIESKEGCELTAQRDPLAKISYQRFFRRYLRLAGMSGTLREVAGELWSVYGLSIGRIPTNRPLQRKDCGEMLHPTADEKWARVVVRIRELHEEGRPVLVGTRSVEASEHLSGLLDAVALPHQVLNARQNEEEAEQVTHAGERGRITVATNMAGRGTDIRLAPGVVERGGLHVIATERHEAGRIDRQLYGRCGRQGDPGSYEALVSLEDELVRVHGGIAGARAERFVRGGVVAQAQRRAERLHGSIRRHVLKSDDQLDSMLAFSGRGE